MKLSCIALALLLVPAYAIADDDKPAKTPAEWYKEGERQYNLREFEAAAEAFKQGYALETSESKQAAYLYNIAQSYRQVDAKCDEAQFYFKRFLDVKSRDKAKPLSAALRTRVEKDIADLEDCARRQEQLNREAAAAAAAAAAEEARRKKEEEDRNRVAVVTPAPEPVDKIVKPATQSAGPQLLSARLVGGGAKITAGNIDIPIRASGALLAGYPIALGDKLAIEVGAGFTFTPVPYRDGVTQMSGTTNFIGALANGGLRYHVAPKIGVRGDFGVGALLMGGAGGSPFTAGAPTSGTLSMLHVRVGVSADYAVTPNLTATVAPISFAYSPPKEGLREDITAITAIDFMVGVGYRM